MDLASEVQGAIVGGAVGVLSAATAPLANYTTLKKRLKSKNQRGLAEFYLDEKLDALASIHTELTEGYLVPGELSAPAEA